MKNNENRKKTNFPQTYASSRKAQSEQGTTVQGIYMSSDPEGIRRLQMLFDEDGISLEKVFAEMVDKLKESGKYPEE